MKKTKLFGSIAILVVLTLSGCDAILETFYPEFGQNLGEGGGNNIRVFVEVIPGIDTVDPQIAVLLENRQTDEVSQIQTVWPFWNWDESGELFLTANVEIFNVPDGEYRVVAWLERTTGANPYNGFPDSDEPQREAEWYPPGSSEPTNSFYFPNEGGNFIEAEAFLEVFEGAAADHNFNMTGEFILNIGGLTSENYVVSPVDTNLTITELWFTLWGPYGEAASGYVPEGDTASFSIDYNNQPEGWYWLDVSVQFSDGWSEYRGSEIRILSNEAAASLDYYVDVVISDVQWALYIYEGETVDYKWGIRYAGTDDVTEQGRGELTVVNDQIVFSTTQLDYNPTESTDGTDGVDMLGIKIDGDRDGKWDYYIEKPLGVSTDDLWGTGNDTVSLWIWSGDFRQYFRS